MKIFLFFLVIFLNKAQKCDRKLVETYNVVSFMEPAKQNMVFCPNIKASCCPSYEQFKIFMTYQNEIKPHYIRLTNLIRDQLERLNKAIEPLFQENSEVKKKIDTIKEVSQKRQAEYLFSRLKPQSFSYYVEKALLRMNRALAYTSSLKSTFFCTICDYDAQKFIDLKRGTVTIQDNTCDEIVQHTLMYSNIINRGIVAYLQDLSELMHRIDNKNKHILLPGFQDVSAAINECALEFKETEEELSSCKKYCGYFRLNSDLPVFEGYPELFLNVLVQIHMNFPSQQKPKRILEALMLDIDNESNNIQNSKERHNKIERALELLGDERILSQDTMFTDDLSESNLRKRSMSMDPYDEELSYPDFDDHMMFDMLQIQDVLSAGEPTDLKKIIKKHYVKSYEPEIEDIEDDIIFKVAPDEKVQLEKLQSIFSFDGIRIAKIIELMDWNLQFHDIVLSLTGKEGDPKNELVDKDLLFFMNNIQNHNVSDFHSDNYLDFNEDKEFVQLDYQKSKKEYQQMKHTKHQSQFEYTHKLLKQYKLQNVDQIVKELESKNVTRETAKIETPEQLAEQKADQAEQKLHELVKEQEDKVQQESDYEANKKFLATLLKDKGLKGVIEDLKKSNTKTAQETAPPTTQPQTTQQTQPTATTQTTPQPNANDQTQNQTTPSQPNQTQPQTTQPQQNQPQAQTTQPQQNQTEQPKTTEQKTT